MSRVAQMISHMNPEQITREDLSDVEKTLLTGFVQEQTGRRDVFVPPPWHADDRPKRRRRT